MSVEMDGATIGTVNLVIVFSFHLYHHEEQEKIQLTEATYLFCIAQSVVSKKYCNMYSHLYSPLISSHYL